MGVNSPVAVVIGERLARYGFPEGHPFGPDRHAAFVREFEARGLHRDVQLLEPREATYDELLAFHTPRYVEFVRERSQSGQGYLDGGDTPPSGASTKRLRPWSAPPSRPAMPS